MTSVSFFSVSRSVPARWDEPAASELDYRPASRKLLGMATLDRAQDDVGVD
jgi:hypothetical protein